MRSLKSLLWVLLISLLWPVKGVLQDFTQEEVKAALVGHIVKNIQWREKAQLPQINIAVYKDENAEKILSQLESVAIANKPVNVSLVNSVSADTQAHVVYVSRLFKFELSQVVAATRGTNTLIISEDSPSLHNVMINIIESDGASDNRRRYQFQINRPNLAFDKLTTLPDLVLFGGSELDVAELYRQTEQAIQSLNQENEKVFNQLKQQKALMDGKEVELANLERSTQQLNQQLIQQNIALQNKEKQLNELTQKAQQANQKYVTARDQASKKETELVTAEQQLIQQQQAVTEQLNLLEVLKSEVADNAYLLEQQSSQLQKQTTQLEEKELEVVDQAKQIEKQGQIIVVVSIAVAVFVLISIVITRLLLNNRRINNELQKTVTRLENTQSQLVESEKMASLGQLVSGVAHELNTPLGISLTAVTTMGDDASRMEELMASQRLKKSEMVSFIAKLKELDALVRSNLERCHKLIQSFKQVSSDQVVAENRQIYLKDYVDEIMRTLSVLLKKNNVMFDVVGENPVINVDPSILNQVINNLTTNAIRHAFDDVEDKQIAIEVVCDGGKVELLFSDNGVGMNAHIREQIFDPFFTTMRGKGGTGLGMNIVHNLVTAKLGGTIELMSEIGEGTQFKISFPQHRSAA